MTELGSIRKQANMLKEPLQNKTSFKVLKIIFLLFQFLCLFYTFSVHAEEVYRMAFISPGGEGDTTSAQPFLDQFFEWIVKQGGPRLTGQYFNTMDEAINVIRKKEASIGLLNLETFLKENQTSPMEVILTTIPLTTGDYKERYFLLAKKGFSSDEESSRQKQTVYASHPVSLNFFFRVLFRNLPLDAPGFFTIEETSNILGKLKKMAEGEKSCCVLLNTYEYQSFKKLALPWTKNLKLASTSREIPTSPVVLLKKVPPLEGEKIIAAFSQMSNSSGGREILRSLRLQGFAKPPLKFYEEVSAEFSNADKPEPITPAESPN